MPAGREPEDRVQLYGVVPPDAFRLAEYVIPDVAPVKPVVVMVSGDCASGVMVTEAVPASEESALLIAVTVAVVLLFTAGAWYRPSLLIVPTEAVQVTAVLEVLRTVAVNCKLAADGKVAVFGLSVIVTGFELETAIFNGSAPPRFDFLSTT